MSYLGRHPRPGPHKPGALSRAVPMGGITGQSLWDLAASYSDSWKRTENPNDACDRAGRVAQQPFYDQMKQIATAWDNRDGFFYITDAIAVIQKGLAFQAQGQSLLNTLYASFGELGQDSLKSARTAAQNDLFDVGRTANDFLAAINTAKAKGATVLDAPGLKDWVIDCLGAAAYAAYVGAYTQCAMPSAAATIVSVMKVFTAAGSAFIAVVKAAATVIAVAGETVYKTTVGTLSFLATAIKFAPFVALAYGASLLWKKHQGR